MDVPVLTDQHLHQLCTDTRRRLKDLLAAMNDWDGWPVRVRNDNMYSG